jgi:hypothetical protein
VNAAPVMATALGLVKRIFNCDVAPGAIDVTLKLFSTVSGEPTVTASVALDALPLPTLVVLMAPLLFKKLAAVALLTLTVTSQLPAAGMVPPVKASDVPPLAAVTVPKQPAPLSEPVAAAVLSKPAG